MGVERSRRRSRSASSRRARASSSAGGRTGSAGDPGGPLRGPVIGVDQAVDVAAEGEAQLEVVGHDIRPVGVGHRRPWSGAIAHPSGSRRLSAGAAQQLGGHRASRGSQALVRRHPAARPDQLGDEAARDQLDGSVPRLGQTLVDAGARSASQRAPGRIRPTPVTAHTGVPARAATAAAAWRPSGGQHPRRAGRHRLDQHQIGDDGSRRHAGVGTATASTSQSTRRRDEGRAVARGHRRSAARVAPAAAGRRRPRRASRQRHGGLVGKAVAEECRRSDPPPSRPRPPTPRRSGRRR